MFAKLKQKTIEEKPQQVRSPEVRGSKVRDGMLTQEELIGV